ncbi:Gfo/Idh/MocA family oxidoreductase [Litorivita sp. NS0012-18]|uniref:Gfo/Idh/MocA family protein n=1 Tax=Litorivita sp. NS0012-18 TaxID=3127655 RepID=UPI003342D7BB
MLNVSIIGAGYVADLYLRSFALYPDIRINGVYDIDTARRDAFCDYWKLTPIASMQALFEATDAQGIILNLTNPHAHYDVSRACLEAGHHVYSEKPLAMQMDQAHELTRLAETKGLRIASAPCSLLSETAQTLWAAVREDVAGKIRLVYAEMDDDFIPQAPYKKWTSDSGAPWPYADEFRVGCTVEHAGYYLAWLLPMFGPVRTVVAASANLADKEIPAEECAPDFSIGALFFESGVVARLTCSILAPHDHELQIIGDKGVISIDECWKNDTPVKYRKRFTLRRRLMQAPFAKKLRLPKGETHAKLGRKGAAAMNFALGPVEMLEAIRDARPCRMSPDLALHINEVTLALQNAGETAGAVQMQTRFAPVAPMAWAEKLA